LNGEKGPKREIVLMNAAAALMVAGKQRICHGCGYAVETIDSKKACEKLEEIKCVTNSF